jgi:hypothetical protein
LRRSPLSRSLSLSLSSNAHKKLKLYNFSSTNYITIPTIAYQRRQTSVRFKIKEFSGTEVDTSIVFPGRGQRRGAVPKAAFSLYYMHCVLVRTPIFDGNMIPKE